MKHFTLSLLAAFLMANSFTFAQTARFRTNVKPVTEKPGKSPRFIFKADEQAGTWKPKTEVLYESDMESGQDDWLKFSTFTHEYDQNGNITSSTEDADGEQMRTLAAYDAFNNRIEKTEQSLEDGQWVNQSKSEYTYDNIVRDFNTERKDYIWNPESGQWVINYAHKKVITRNTKGYVTIQSIQLLNQNNQYDEIERTEITYTDGDLPATSWKFFQADQKLEMHEKVRYDKINWDRSDGQVLASEEAFMVGNNRIKKADIYDEGVKTATFNCTYVDGKTDFDCLIKSTSSLDETQHKLTELDQNGSYKEEITDRLDENGDGQLTTYGQYMVATFDIQKNPISEEYFEVTDEMTEQIDGAKLLYTYGPNNEITETINQGYNYESGEYVNTMKIEASDFVFFTSEISSIRENHSNLKLVLSDNLVKFETKDMNHYDIYSSTGTLISSGMIENNQGEIGITGLPSGIYFIKVTGNQSSESAKFIKR